MFGLNFSRSKSGDDRLLGDYSRLQDNAYRDLTSGQKLTDEGLAGLRGLDSTYSDRLRDPLGEVGRGIFSRARGAVTDEAQRRSRSTEARLFQLARQSGGSLSPEAIAQLRTQSDRDLDEQAFTSRNELFNEEAAANMQETSKLFDRMEGIRKTIVGVGQDERTRSLQAIIAGLTGRTGRTGSYGGGISAGK